MIEIIIADSLKMLFILSVVVLKNNLAKTETICVIFSLFPNKQLVELPVFINAGNLRLFLSQVG
jgi:hypothetical protein